MVDFSLASPAKYWTLLAEGEVASLDEAGGRPRRDKLVTRYPSKAARLHTA